MRRHENERTKFILLVLLFLRSHFRMATSGTGLATVPEARSTLYTRRFASWLYCHLQVTGCLYWSSSWRYRSNIQKVLFCPHLQGIPKKMDNDKATNRVNCF
jgi:hypothetical protein